MDKLRLHLDDLVVESFAPAMAVPGAGTVQARQSGPVTDECDTCGPDSMCNVCDTNSCQCGNTNTCYGWQTCGGANTCGGVDTCVWPQCTAYGEIC